MPALFKVFMRNHFPLSKHLTSLMSWKGWNIHVPGQIVFLKIRWLIFLEKGPVSKLFLGWQCATDLDPKTCWVKTSPGVERGLEHWQLSGWKCKQEANHFAVTVSNIPITHFAVWETNFTTDCQNNLLRHHSTHSFGQANWSASVKQLCNKDDLERFSAKKTASLLRASFSKQISKNCLCYPSIFRTGFLRRLFHVGLRS